VCEQLAQGWYLKEQGRESNPRPLIESQVQLQPLHQQVTLPFPGLRRIVELCFFLPIRHNIGHFANRHLLAVPRFPLNTYCRRAFSVAGPYDLELTPGFYSGSNEQHRLF